VEGHIKRVRKQTWALAAFFLIAFCWLGFVSVQFARMFQGFQVTLPLSVRFLTCGPIAFPLIGLAAGGAFILSDVFLRNRWTRWALTAFFTLFIVWVLFSLVRTRIILMESSVRADKYSSQQSLMASIPLRH
jgi:hypothetical protein